jgi:hypothetical protein
VVAAKVTIINQPIEVKLFGTQGDALERLVVLFTNVSDNLYNIAGIMGAQLTSLKETEDALKDSMAAAKDAENQQLEARREEKKSTGKEKESKNPFQKLIDFFEGLINILIPFIVGFFIGLKKEFGLIAALVLVFRKQIFSVLKLIPGIVKGAAEGIGKLFNSTKNIFANVVTRVGSVSGSIATQFSKAVGSIKNTFRALLVINSNLIGKIVDFFTRIKNLFTSNKLIATISGAFNKMFSIASDVGKTITNVGVRLKSVAKMIATPFQILSNAVSKLGDLFKGPVLKAIDLVSKAFDTVKGLFKPLASVFKAGASFGRILGPIGVAIGAVMAVFKGVRQAFAGFEKEGIFGAIKGFAAGIVSSVVGFLGDIGSFIIGKLLSLLGFEELGERIASLDFTEMLNQAIMGLFDNVKSAFTGMFGKLTGGFKKIFSGEDIIGGIVDVFTAIPGLLIDLITSPFEALGEAIKEVFDFDFAALAKKLLIAIAPPDSVVGKMIGTGQMQKEVDISDAQMQAQRAAKEEAKKDEAKQEGSVAATSPTPTPSPTPTQTQATRSPVSAAPVARAAPGAAPVTPTAMAPVATAAPGAAINMASQNVAGVPRGAGGSSQNVVAPVTTTNVNNSQSQNVSIRPNATPTFGMSNSGTGAMVPVFGF